MTGLLCFSPTAFLSFVVTWFPVPFQWPLCRASENWSFNEVEERSGIYIDQRVRHKAVLGVKDTETIKLRS